MSPKEIKALVKTLRSLGVTHYKTADIDLLITPEKPVVAKAKSKKLLEKEEKEIKHKIEEMTSLMKMGDVELIDRLFPDHQQEAESEH
jgi:hypothetical protein